MRFVIIRHGQSTNNLLYEQTGDSVGRDHDAPLTDLGHRQAALLADTVADGALPWPITHLYSSLMLRAVQTAAPLADRLDLPHHALPHAHEIGGLFIESDDGVRTAHPGPPASELLSASSRLVLPESATEEGWFTGPYEDGHDLPAARARRLIDALRADHTEDDTVALVTHGAFFQHLFRALLRIEAMSGWVVKHNTAISLFADEIWGGKENTVTAHRIDWMPHLSEDLISE